MKKISIIITIISILLLYAFLSCSSSGGTKHSQLNTVSVYLNGSKIVIGTIFYKGILYVPINEICFYFKCDYTKDDEKKIINFITFRALKDKPGSIDKRSKGKKMDIKIENSDYQTMIDGLLLFISPIVYDNIFYIPLGYFAESFEKSTKWGGLFKNTVKVKDYPEEYIGSVNGVKIKKRFFNERYLSKYMRLETGDEKKDNKGKNKKKITKEQKVKLEEVVFNEIVEMMIASQKASEYGIVKDEDVKNHINYYLGMTVSRYGGIDGFRNTFGKTGVTYQDAVNYFTYGVIKEKLMEKMTFKGIEPPEDMMREYYDSSRSSFIKPAKAIVKHIIIPTKDQNENSFGDAKVEEQKKLAEMILAKIKNGEDFEELRKKYSKDYYPGTKDQTEGFAVEYGLQTIAKVFEDAVFKLKTGEISDVVKTYRGFHIIKLISKTESKEKTFEESKERIKRDLAYTAKINYLDESMQKWKEECVVEKQL